MVNEPSVFELSRFNCIFLVCFSDPCNGRLTDTTGEFSSVDRDGNGRYDPNLNCSWDIIAEEDEALQLKIISMDIEKSARCAKDYLKVRIYLAATSENVSLDMCAQ